tara:strand:- start:349 stop:585 length:237 start_codon:yes stop_codon:yes gene_type:complete
LKKDCTHDNYFTEGYIAEAAEAEKPAEEPESPPKSENPQESLESLPSPPSFKDSTPTKSTSQQETGKFPSFERNMVLF